MNWTKSLNTRLLVKKKPKNNNHQTNKCSGKKKYVISNYNSIDRKNQRWCKSKQRQTWLVSHAPLNCVSSPLEILFVHQTMSVFTQCYVCDEIFHLGPLTFGILLARKERQHEGYILKICKVRVWQDILLTWLGNACTDRPDMPCWIPPTQKKVKMLFGVHEQQSKT